MSKEDWILCSERYPDAELDYCSEYLATYTSEEVLIQTKKGDNFVATYTRRECGSKRDKVEHIWFSYGTGGRRMKVVSTVIAWMPFEPYEA